MIYALNRDYSVRSLNEADVEGPYPSWFEDQEVCKFNSHGKFFKNKEWFRQYVAALNEENKIVWAICHQTDGHIGNVSLQNISLINRNAEFAIILGDKRHIGKGAGKLAGRQLVQHGFHKLNLERIYCGTAETNAAMIALAQSLGMVEEGRRRKHLFLEGSWVDQIDYGLLRSE